MRWAIALTCGLLALALPAPVRAAETNEAAALQAAEAWLTMVLDDGRFRGAGYFIR